MIYSMIYFLRTNFFSFVFTLCLSILLFCEPLRFLIISFLNQYKTLNLTFWNVYLKNIAFIFLFCMILFFFLQYLFFPPYPRKNLNIFLNKIKTFLSSSFVPYFLFFLLLVLYHSLMVFAGDDTLFATILKKQDLLNWTITRYYQWSSRIFIEMTVVIFSALPFFVWKILNILIYLSIPFSLHYLINHQNKLEHVYLLVFLIALYPFYQMGSAGWIATMTNYAFPFACLLIVFCFLKLIYFNKLNKFNYFLLPFVLFSLCIATSQEQSTVCLILTLFYLIVLRPQVLKNIFFQIVLILTLIMFCAHYFSPGNALRLKSEMMRFPAFSDFNLIQKLSLGVLISFVTLFKQKMLFFIFHFVLSILIFKQKNKILIFSILLQCFVALLFIQHPYLNKEDIIPSFHSYFLFYFSLMIFWFVLSFYHLFILFPQKPYCILFVFLIGCISKSILAFSPTVFASDDRTAIFLYFSFIVILYFLILEWIKINPKIKQSVFVFLGILSFYTAFQIMFLAENKMLLPFSPLDKMLAMLFLIALIFKWMIQNHFNKINKIKK